MGRWSNAAATEDYIPKDSDDLVRHYDSFVAWRLRKLNRVSANFRDIYQHVWLKLFEVNIVDKYRKAVGTLPKTMTGAQACAYLGMSFQSFKLAIYRHQVGDDRVADSLRSPKAISDAVFERDQGVCYCCGRDMERFRRSMLAWRTQDASVLDGDFQSLSVDIDAESGDVVVNLLPKKQNYQAFRQKLKDEYGVTPWHKVFWIAERIPGTPNRTSADSYRTRCFICLHKINPIKDRVRRKSAWAPSPVQGGYGSQKAVYRSEDIERFKTLRKESRKSKDAAGEVVVFQTKKPSFKLYLATAVHNIYANWCRTRFRRYKETYYGDREDGTSWDSFLEDARCRPDDMVDLYHTSKMLAAGESDIRDVDFSDKAIEANQEKILALLADGYTLNEVVAKLSLPTAMVKAIAF